MLVEKELKKLRTPDFSYIWGKNYFEGNDGTQNTLVFQVKDINFRRKIKIGSGNAVYAKDVWKSKGLSTQSLDLWVHKTLYKVS